MKTETAFLLFGLVSIMAIADETNWVTTAPQFRDVNGQLYNTERSTNFQYFVGNVVKVLTNAVALQKQWESFNPHTGQWQKYTSDKIFITNFPASFEATTGSNQHGKAMKIGIINFDGDVLQLWDYGTPHRVKVVSTNNIEIR